MTKLHAPRHAGRTIAGCVVGGDAFRVTFDPEGYLSCADDVATHLVACGNGLIGSAANEILPPLDGEEQAGGADEEGEAADDGEDFGDDADGEPEAGEGGAGDVRPAAKPKRKPRRRRKTSI